MTLLYTYVAKFVCLLGHERTVVSTGLSINYNKFKKTYKSRNDFPDICSYSYTRGQGKCRVQTYQTNHNCTCYICYVTNTVTHYIIN